MTAVKSLTHIQQLAQQRLPVPSAEVERLCERVKELEKTLAWLVEIGCDHERYHERAVCVSQAKKLLRASSSSFIRSLMDKG